MLCNWTVFISLEPPVWPTALHYTFTCCSHIANWGWPTQLALVTHRSSMRGWWESSMNRIFCCILFAQSFACSFHVFHIVQCNFCFLVALFAWNKYESRSHREHGLHDRAMACGATLPCPISWVTIPLRDSVDDPSYKLVEWPILLPKDFVSRLDFGLGVLKCNQ